MLVILQLFSNFKNYVVFKALAPKLHLKQQKKCTLRLITLPFSRIKIVFMALTPKLYLKQ